MPAKPPRRCRSPWPRHARSCTSPTRGPGRRPRSRRGHAGPAARGPESAYGGAPGVSAPGLISILAAIQVRRGTQDQGSDTRAHVEHDRPGSRGAVERLGHRGTMPVRVITMLMRVIFVLVYMIFVLVHVSTRFGHAGTIPQAARHGAGLRLLHCVCSTVSAPPCLLHRVCSTVSAPPSRIAFGPAGQADGREASLCQSVISPAGVLTAGERGADGRPACRPMTGARAPTSAIGARAATARRKLSPRRTPSRTSRRSRPTAPTRPIRWTAPIPWTRSTGRNPPTTATTSTAHAGWQPRELLSRVVSLRVTGMSRVIGDGDRDQDRRRAGGQPERGYVRREQAEQGEHRQRADSRPRCPPPDDRLERRVTSEVQGKRRGIIQEGRRGALGLPGGTARSRRRLR